MSVKKLVTFLLLGFALFFIISQPVEAAQLVSDVFEAASNFFRGAADSFSTFIRSLS